MASGAESLPVSVVVPTLGRLEPLRDCLNSLAACSPRAVEILVIDQSGDLRVAELVGAYADVGARLVACAGRGVSKGRNDGLRAAGNELVLVTDDDCTVEPDWIDVAYRQLGWNPDAIVTGRVLPVGDPRAVPSTKLDTTPFDYTGRPRPGVLFPNNMALRRSAVLAEEGGFDERFGPDEAAEDNDFCYRWLRAGHGLRYEPSLVVHHHDWRRPAELEAMYVRYARGEGFLYAKHLRRGDLRIARFLMRDLAWGVRGLLSAVVKGREAWTDSRRGILRGLPGGFRDGWRVYGRSAGTQEQS